MPESGDRQHYKGSIKYCMIISNTNIKQALFYAAHFTSIMIFLGLFFRFAGWFLDGKPISEIKGHNLSNLPPPEWAVSFSVNHGQAMYYAQPIPSQAPIQVFFIGLAFIVCFYFIRFFYEKARGI